MLASYASMMCGGVLENSTSIESKAYWRVGRDGNKHIKVFFIYRIHKSKMSEFVITAWLVFDRGDLLAISLDETSAPLL